MNETTLAYVLGQIREERYRQERLRASGKFPFTCADEGLYESMRLACLTEEIGEVARELMESLNNDRAIDYDALLAELLQVAAISCAWCEHLLLRKVNTLQERLF